MDNKAEIMLDPEKYGYEQCPQGRCFLLYSHEASMPSSSTLKLVLWNAPVHCH